MEPQRLEQGHDGLQDAQHRPHRQRGRGLSTYYGQQSCTAGRAAFITGQSPFRTGLTKVGLPGAAIGLQKEDPTIAEMLKPLGYMCGQFGKNHLGDRDEFLPTAHGFDEFFGNLYHLNAEEEPENPDYPKGADFRKKFGPRGVLKTSADGKIEDTGPLTKKRMETVDEEFLAAAKDFMDRQVKANKPFFVWFNSTRMHVNTHLKPASDGKTGLGLQADGMVEHDSDGGRPAEVPRGPEDRRQHAGRLFDRQRRHEEPVARCRRLALPVGEGHQLGRRLPRALRRALAGRHQAGHDRRRPVLGRGLAADAGRRRGAIPASRTSCSRAIRPAARPSRSISTATTSCRC